MKGTEPIGSKQYAYTSDGRVIRIEEVMENGWKYRGINIKEAGCPEVMLNRSEIYGVAFKIGHAV